LFALVILKEDLTFAQASLENTVLLL
jgi:hypothetical protein